MAKSPKKSPKSKAVAAPRADIHDRITDTIVAALEEAANPTEWPWVKAARAGAPVNVSSKKPYRGINRMFLGLAMSGGASKFWGTFNQWSEKGATVNKGSKGTLVVYYGELWIIEETGARVEPHTPGSKKILYAKGATVFHAGQVTGWIEPEADKIADELAAAAGADHLDEIEAFVAATGAIITEGGDRACFMPGMDEIRMPDRARFKDTDSGTATTHFYGTLMHELIHWTGIEKRCKRDMSGNFGSTKYAFEELVAEIGSAFLCADLGISPEPRADNVAYVANWLQVLKNDKKAIFTASSLSAKANDFLHGLQPAIVADEAEEQAEAA